MRDFWLLTLIVAFLAVGLAALTTVVDGPALTTQEWITRTLVTVPLGLLGGAIVALIARLGRRFTTKNR